MPNAAGEQELLITGRISEEFLTDLADTPAIDYQFTIYPNPSHNFIQINSDENLAIDKISIYNSVGQIVETIPEYRINQKIEVSSFESGQYYLRIDSGESVAIRSFSVSK